MKESYFFTWGDILRCKNKALNMPFLSGHAKSLKLPPFLHSKMLLNSNYETCLLKPVTYLGRVIASYDSLIEVVVLRPSCPHFFSNFFVIRGGTMVGEMLISGRTCRILHRIVSRINSGMVDPEKENGRRKPK
jgi:hypothetical protein